jgi:hypothetical protein
MVNLVRDEFVAFVGQNFCDYLVVSKLFYDYE